MNLPKASVKRPVFTSMVVMIVVALGLASLFRLQVDLLPDVEMPRVTVSADYDGASPEVMERTVTQILEEIIGTVPGVEEMTSTSSEGSSSVRVTFSWGTDLDAATTELRSRLENELEELPEEVSRPTIRKFDVNSFPVVLLGVSSKLDPVELTTLVEDQIRYRFARLPGVAQVDGWGGYYREVRVELDPERIRALGIPLNVVLQSLRDANLDLPAGEIEAGRYQVMLRAPAEFDNIDDIRATVVALRDGAPVTLDQIADVADTYERITRIVRVNGRLGQRLAIRKNADANTVEVAGAILAEIDNVNADYPQIEVVPIINQGNFIERSIKNVGISVVYGGGLAVFVLFFFLRRLSTTLVISLAIPISVIATFALLYAGGFTLNLMTLGGLALGVGMMVDSSIVVLENIFRRSSEDGLDAKEASVQGATEVGPAILASTLTTLVIFLPVVFIQGVSGLLFRELAYVIGFALVCSLLVSLSLVPMLSSKLLSQREDKAGAVSEKLHRFFERAFTALDDTYRDLVNVVVRFRILTLLTAAVVFGASMLLAGKLGTEFIPPSDEGEVRVTGEMEIGTRLDIVDAQARKMEDIVTEMVPEAVAWVTSVGSSSWNPDEGATGEIQMSLVPASERSRSNAEIAEELRARLEGKIAGMEIRTRAPQGQRLLSRILGGDDSGITVEIRGYELERLGALTEAVAAAIEGIPGIENIDTNVDPGVPQQRIRVDRQKAADVGLSVRDITSAIETAIAGSRAGEYRPEGESYRILVRFQNAERMTIDEVLDLTLRGASGEDVVLRNLVSTEPGRGPTIIRRKDQQRQVGVSADVVGRDLGSVAADVEAALAGIPRPAGYDFSLAGNVEEQRRSQIELLSSLALAIVLVYMVLACQYESLRDPLLVMLSVPLAAIGVVVMLYLTDTTLNLQSYIGCIMLGGIVVNNSILIVDQASRLRTRDNMPTNEAVAEAGRRRLRPILMTTLTTMLGLAPLALGIGEGADTQAPLARAVIGGLLVSTLTTLFVVPAAYAIMHGGARPGSRSSEAVAAAPA